MASGGNSNSGKGKGKIGESSIPTNDIYDMIPDQFNFEGFPNENLDIPTQESEFNEQFQEDEEQEQEQRAKIVTRARQSSDIFSIHFTKKFKGEKMYDVICNYCGKSYKFKQAGGYGSFWKHLETKHPTKIGVDRSQQQISGYASNLSLFKYSEKIQKEELAKMISMEHLSFSFGEKVGFNNYCQKALNPCAKRVPRNTVKRTIISLYNKGKKELELLFSQMKIRVSICCDIWSDHWQMHSYMGITCHWIDDDWKIQKRIIAFHVFDDKHTANNIYRIIVSILDDTSYVKNFFQFHLIMLLLILNQLLNLKIFVNQILVKNFFI